jgi:phosphomannomutase
MITINIKQDFSPTTGFRTYEDGPKSGLEFYDVLLKNKFSEAIENKVKLKIILDGGEGYTSSFLNEAFRLLGKNFGSELVWQNIIIISEEVPKYIKKIKDSVYEMEK